MLRQTASTLACANPENGAPCAIAPGNRYFPFAAESTEEGYDLNGAALPTVTTKTSYDPYGNATSVEVSTDGGEYKRTTTNTFTNDAAKWFLGRLTGSSVKSEAP